ncbi:MAG: hypothetical protein IPI67_13395 [Myxococcales bacterium]|nr:hypothetical protein [Myxococcales bacterium]
MKRLRVFSATGLAVIAACTGARFEGTAQGPAVSMPAHIGEGSDQDAGVVADAASDARQLIGAAERKPGPGSQPDPEGIAEKRHYEYEVVYAKGKVQVVSVRAVRFTHAVPSVRKMGRFAIELWLGRELIERVRFDIPLVAAEDPRRKRAHPLHEPPSFAAGVEATLKIMVPASARATRAVLLDRATGDKQDLPWPPDAPLGPINRKLPVDAGMGADASSGTAAGDATTPELDAGSSGD